MPTYRYYQKKIDDDVFLSEQVKEGFKTCAEPKSNSVLFNIMLFVVGAAVGGVLIHK